MPKSATVPGGGIPPTTSREPVVRLACHVHYCRVEVLREDTVVGPGKAGRQGNDVASVGIHLIGELADGPLEFSYAYLQCCVRAWRAETSSAGSGGGRSRWLSSLRNSAAMSYELALK